MPLGQCHLCGRVLIIHSHFVAEGYQHEEYYCDGCGEFSRGVFPLRLDDPAWRELYERRQKLIEQGPRRRRFTGHRHQATRKWAEEIGRLTRQLLDIGETDPSPGNTRAEPRGYPGGGYRELKE